MKVITLLNEKGGVGKTTLAKHLGAGLALLGNKVMLVDSDAQGSLTLSLGHKPSPGFYDLLVRGVPFSDVLIQINPEQYQLPKYKSQGDLYLLPGNKETRTLHDNLDDAFAIKRTFEVLADTLDYIIIDTSPTPSLLHAIIYLATDAIIIPLKCEYLSYAGLMSTVSNVKRGNRDRERFNMPPLEIAGIMPNLFRKNTLEHNEVLSKLVKEFDENVWSPIPMSTLYAEASRMHRAVWALDPSANTSKVVLNVVKRFIERERVHGS